MAQVQRESTRLAELKQMLLAYRHMTIEEADAGDAGDRQIEIEHEVWRIEQDLRTTKLPSRAA